ncbi:PTS system beta-glucoside-specific transporter subunit IIA [Listeria fleischmannii 1991]|uniref:N,N'-diacetylchitobiose-specific phosphotransferase enzyme IIA component n=2 Tax=Listeria fleischmannii TaxID=1069827 RepID=A0A2X3GJU3_9LIST|nr:PTS lactose/cellobiose transporter subunit IIA [Listeria fleischmannii]EMG27264.1 PTS system beta-glucoside-specific transporter subunit IIA [Listeria fleischmannii subsp. fleischmannii LU2006-1]KMT58361.1 PTS system beta-glucoside-specific transporter subunit IIA [Listeria fleischmannii 1991]SQC68488.1 N,N'-diacetylchitobiose-specific phosphotransferase enzyme IIA component [Listeria fleischmannii subsp. fleischmannii]
MEIKVEEAVVKMIFHGGNTRKEAYSAIEAAENYDFKSAESHLKTGLNEYQSGHSWQVKLVAQREHDTPSFLLIHGQDHLMTAHAELNLAEKLVKVYKREASLIERIEKLEQLN